jgi:hypothetical protein
VPLPVPPAPLALEEPAAPLELFAPDALPCPFEEPEWDELAAPPEEVALDELPAALLLESAELPLAEEGLLLGSPFERP